MIKPSVMAEKYQNECADCKQGFESVRKDAKYCSSALQAKTLPENLRKKKNLADKRKIKILELKIESLEEELARRKRIESNTK